MKLLIFTILLTTTAILSGCASNGGERKILNSWQGEHIESVLLHWGSPDRQTTLSNGRVMHEWFANRQYNMPSNTTGSVNVIGKTAYINTITTGGGVISGNCRRSFITNESGIIVDGRANGNDCCVMAIAGYCASLLNPNEK